MIEIMFGIIAIPFMILVAFIYALAIWVLLIIEAVKYFWYEYWRIRV